MTGHEIIPVGSIWRVSFREVLSMSSHKLATPGSGMLVAYVRPNRDYTPNLDAIIGNDDDPIMVLGPLQPNEKDYYDKYAILVRGSAYEISSYWFRHLVEFF